MATVIDTTYFIGTILRNGDNDRLARHNFQHRTPIDYTVLS